MRVEALRLSRAAGVPVKLLIYFIYIIAFVK